MKLMQLLLEQTQLNESEYGRGYTIKKLKDEEWADWVEQHCSNYLSRASRYRIYSDLPDYSVKLGIKNTNEFRPPFRDRWDDHLFYELWIDNAPQWRDYPKLSKSFIGFSNPHSARHFDELVMLFPADDAKIGIAPTDDILLSFSKNIPGGNLDKFNDFVGYAIYVMYGDAGLEKAGNNWTAFKQLLERTTFGEFLEATRKYKFYADLIKNFNEGDYPRLIDFFEEEIVPEKHGFQHTTPANYSVTEANKRAVWVQGKVALLGPKFIFNPVYRRKFPKTIEFLSKYRIKFDYDAWI